MGLRKEQQIDLCPKGDCFIGLLASFAAMLNSVEMKSQYQLGAGECN